MTVSLRTILLTSVLTLLCLQPALAQQSSETKELIAVGATAPSFTLKDDQGKDWSTDDHYGKGEIVLYFYPADMTPGCTRQACGYRDNLAKLKQQGITVVGISGDSVRNHQLFKKAHDLNFTLLSDPKGEAAAKFGVPSNAGERSITREIDGKEEVLVRTATTQRYTVVVGKDKRVKRSYKVSDAGGDSLKILSAAADAE